MKIKSNQKTIKQYSCHKYELAFNYLLGRSLKSTTGNRIKFRALGMLSYKK